MLQSKELESTLQQVFEVLAVMENAAVNNALEASKLEKSTDVLNFIKEAAEARQKVQDLERLFGLNEEAEMAELQNTFPAEHVYKFYPMFTEWPGRDGESMGKMDLIESFETFMSECHAKNYFKK